MTSLKGEALLSAIKPIRRATRNTNTKHYESSGSYSEDEKYTNNKEDYGFDVISKSKNKLKNKNKLEQKRQITENEDDIESVDSDEILDPLAQIKGLILYYQDS